LFSFNTGWKLAASYTHAHTRRSIASMSL